MNNKKNMKNTMSVILCTAALATLFSFTAMATQNTYAENGAKWILDGIFWVVAVGGIFGAGLSAVKRNATGAIGTLLGAALICVLCKNPDLLTTIGNALKGIIGL